MILPFVRELLADVESTPTFQRTASLLKARAGRSRVSGLTPAGKALHLPLLQRSSSLPLIVIVADNRAAEELLPMLQSLCEVTGVVDPKSVIKLPAHDVLPFENLSPHPEIQEERASALWKIVSGEADIVVTPMEAASMRMRAAEFYSELARVVRKGETVDPDSLIQHLNIVGYTQTDVVDMPGEYASRGGIFDVYPPEADRPLRVELFGDEIESIRKFDPATQRSATNVDEVVLLPLTETPVSETVLAAIHTRLSGARITGSQEEIQQAIEAGGVTSFPGWEFYAPVAGAVHSIFDLLPNAAVILDEPSAVLQKNDDWWEKIVDRHERSGVGALVRPEELYFPPEDWRALLRRTPGFEIEELGIESGVEQIVFHSQPTSRFHGPVPAMVDEVKKLTAEGKGVL